MAVTIKPDKASYENSLQQAELLRNSAKDPHHLAHSLLYLAERNQQLEKIAAAEEYIRFGQDQHLHTKLLKALEDFKDYEVEVELMEDPRFGLN